jgi:hypothetical protein
VLRCYTLLFTLTRLLRASNIAAHSCAVVKVAELLEKIKAAQAKMMKDLGGIGEEALEMVAKKTEQLPEMHTSQIAGHTALEHAHCCLVASSSHVSSRHRVHFLPELESSSKIAAAAIDSAVEGILVAIRARGVTLKDEIASLAKAARSDLDKLRDQSGIISALGDDFTSKLNASREGDGHDILSRGAGVEKAYKELDALVRSFQSSFSNRRDAKDLIALVPPRGHLRQSAAAGQVQCAGRRWSDSAGSVRTWNGREWSWRSIQLQRVRIQL